MSKATTSAAVAEPEEREMSRSLSEILEQFVLDHAREAVSLPELIVEVLGGAVSGESLRRGVERIISRRLTAEQGRMGALSLSRSLTKQIDGTLEAEMRGVTVAQRRALLRLLVEAASLHFIEAAAALTAYIDAAADLAQAREDKSAGKAVLARLMRVTAEKRLDMALLNANRALMGADRE